MAENHDTEKRCNAPSPSLESVSPCSLVPGHGCKHCNGSIEWDVSPCYICGSRNGVRRFAVIVDGEALHLAPLLCGECGDSFLLRVGILFGDLRAIARERAVKG